jgi:tight adherence protein B
VPLTVTLALMRAVIVAGADVRTALEQVGASLTQLDPDADSLVTVSKRLALGLPWPEAWAGTPERLAPVERAFRLAWSSGASPVAALDAAADALARQSRRAGERAAAELGVRLTIPLSLCLLPAFVLTGIVPLLLALARGVLAGM